MSKNRKILLSCIAILGSISIFLFDFRKNKEQSDDLLKSFKAVDDSLQMSNNSFKAASDSLNKNIMAKFDSLEEDKVFDVVTKLPIVKKKSDEIERLFDSKRHVVVYISGMPDDQHKYYTVSVGEDNELNVVTYFIFHVEPGSMNILNKDGRPETKHH